MTQPKLILQKMILTEAEFQSGRITALDPERHTPATEQQQIPKVNNTSITLYQASFLLLSFSPLFGTLSLFS